ncbi:RGA2 [Candida margitis]|uniref:RGA2 n=1 Tax=Candida margitis TaxID=1775924 RepID=UPI0022264A10|nr:RGA2 [Candida margitis]KAI5970082.1 RGA2 [Candida margitis]
MTEVETNSTINAAAYQPSSSNTTPTTSNNGSHSNYMTPRTNESTVDRDDLNDSSQNYHSPTYHQREVCKKCNQQIIEGHAYELGEDRWHIDCFKCSKCETSLGCNSNFLVLGNGNLICSNCSYNCKQCGRKIDDLAILTGDQAYCSSCFKCRSCKRKIEDLRYARTSKGLFCMDCHEKLMAKKKKYDAKKRQLATLQERQSPAPSSSGAESKALEDYRRASASSSRNSLIQSYMTNTYNSENNKSASTTSLYKQGENNSQLSMNSNKNKSLPRAPNTQNTSASSSSIPSSRQNLSHDNSPANPNNYSIQQTRESSRAPANSSYSQTATHEKPGRKSNSNGNPSPGAAVFSPENDFSIEEVQNSSDSDTNEPDTIAQTKGTSLRTKTSSNIKGQLESHSSHNSPINTANSKNPDTPASQLSNPDKSIYLDFSDFPSDYPARSEQRKYSNNNQLDAPADLKSSSDKRRDGEKHLTPQNVPQEVAGDMKNKNLLILSPGQFHDHEFHSATMGSPLIDSPGTLLSRSSTNDNKLKAQSLTIEQEQHSNRSQCPSPYAKANRQARVVEMNDEIQTDAVPVDSDIAANSNSNSNLTYTTPQQSRHRKMSGSGSGTAAPIGSSLSSPPPKLPVPDTPTRKRERLQGLKFDESVAYGLGLEGITYSDDSGKLAVDQENEQREYMRQVRQQQEQEERGIPTNSLTPERTKEELNKLRSDYTQTPFSINQSPRIISNPTPAVTNLEPENDEEQSQAESPSQPQKLSRTTSLIRNLKHKRSVSGGNQSKFGFFKSSPREDVNKGQHTRHISDSSIAGSTLAGLNSIHSQYFTSPGQSEKNGGVDRFKPPYSQTHARSTSDSTMFFDNDPFDIKAVKTEVQKLAAEKLNLDLDVKKLKQDKLRLGDQLKSIQSNLTDETIKYDNLVAEIRDLEERKALLSQQNKELEKQNEQLEVQQKQHQMRQQTTSSGLDRFGSSESDALGDDVSTNFSTASTVRDGKSFGYNDHQQSHYSQQQRQQPQQQQQQQQPLAAPEDEQTHKATRLKFWRRAKTGAPHVVSTRNDNNGSGNNYGTNISGPSLPHSTSSQALRVPVSSNGNSTGGGSKFSRSTSTNILDSFLNTDYNGSSSSVLQLTKSKSNSTASLFNTTLQQRAEFEKTSVPLIISRCLIEVEKRGLEVEGIYRISGGNSAIVAIENAFSNLGQDPDDKQWSKLNDLLDGDIHSVTSALKRYLRKLPDPVIPIVHYDEFIRIARSQNRDSRLDSLSSLVEKLPTANRSVLYALCQHLHKVAELKEVNRMGVKNLSVVFAPTLARDETGEREMVDMGSRNDMTELLLTEYSKVFRQF